MARPIDRKCLRCAESSVEDAISLHGQEGDGCWNISQCHQRRSHYRNRRDRNSNRQVAYKISKSKAETTEEIELSTAQIASIVLVIYKDEFTKDAPIHAIGAELWIGTEEVAHMKPTSCLGMRGDQVTALMPQILRAFSKDFSEQYNQGKSFNRFAAKIERHISQCPMPTPFSKQASEQHENPGKIVKIKSQKP